MAKKSVRPKNWTLLSYDDVEVWRPVVDALHIPYYAMLHDADENDDGTAKREHWHIVLEYGVNRTIEQVREDVGAISANGYVEPVVSLTGMVRYLTHIDNPEKAQYDMENMLVGGGAEVARHFERSRKLLSDADLFVYIADSGYRNYAALVLHCIRDYPEMWAVLRTVNCHMVTQFMRSLEFAER